MAEKRLSDIIDEIVLRYNEKYRTKHTREQLEPIIRFQWSQIRKATDQDKEPYIKVPNFGVFSIRPTFMYNRCKRLKFWITHLSKNKNQTNVLLKIEKYTNLVKRWLEIWHERKKHYEKHYINHPDANPITFKER